MPKDKQDNQPPDEQDEASLQSIRDAVNAAEDWDAQNPQR